MGNRYNKMVQNKGMAILKEKYDLSEQFECDRCIKRKIACRHQPYDWCQN